MPIRGLTGATEGVSDPYGKFGPTRKSGADGQVAKRFFGMGIKKLETSPKPRGDRALVWRSLQRTAAE